jgi:hypothetical protein
MAVRAVCAQPGLAAEVDARDRTPREALELRGHSAEAPICETASRRRGIPRPLTHERTRAPYATVTIACFRIPAYSSVSPTSATPTAAVAACAAPASFAAATATSQFA